MKMALAALDVANEDGIAALERFNEDGIAALEVLTKMA
jgi:hypothetical protein